jgi:hypothetical protein
MDRIDLRGIGGEGGIETALYAIDIAMFFGLKIQNVTRNVTLKCYPKNVLLGLSQPSTCPFGSTWFKRASVIRSTAAPLS